MESLLIIGELSNDQDLVRLFEREGYRVSVRERRRGALDLVRGGDVAVVVMSQRLGQDDSVGLLKAVRAADPRCEVIIVSSSPTEVELPTNIASMQVAIEALREGALDYLRRPISLRHLRTALSHARRARAATIEHESGFLAAE